MGDQDRYIYLKKISLYFIKRRPTSILELILEDDAGDKQESSKFKKSKHLHWKLDTYVRIHTMGTLTIRQVHLKASIAEVSVTFKPNQFRDDRVVRLKDSRHRFTIDFMCGRSQSLADVTRFLDFRTRTDLASKIPRLLKHPQQAALPPPTSDDPYVTIHWLNDDILLGVFNCYRLHNEYHWNRLLWWCKLSHVCQRWRHLIHECASHLDMQIPCTNRNHIVGTLDHLPPLPLFVHYTYPREMVPTEQDELRIYHALRLHDRVRYLYLHLPPSILHKALLLMDEPFPILEVLILETENCIPFTLPKAFVAPNLRELGLPGISPPRRLRLLTSPSTVSLVALTISNIETSSYFRPRVLIARLSSLPQLEDLYIGFSIPIPGPSTERELLGEQRASVTLSSLKTLRFKGVSAYLESLVAQITVPLLERLDITLFNQIIFALPHLDRLINITDRLKLPDAVVLFRSHEITVTTKHSSYIWEKGPLSLRVMCQPLDWQIDCAAQICSGIIPTLSSVERLRLERHFSGWDIPTELQNGAIDSTTWHELLRSFIGVQELYISHKLLEELSRALQTDEVGLDPGFLPNLRSIYAKDNLFSPFINTRRIMGRPVQFSSPTSSTSALTTSTW